MVGMRSLRPAGRQRRSAVGAGHISPQREILVVVLLTGRIGRTVEALLNALIGLEAEFGRKRWGDGGYAAEELVAELGAAFLCADLTITLEVREDHAAYIGNWLKVLKDDKRAIFTAAAHAQRAVDFLLQFSGKAEQPDAEPLQSVAA